MPNAERSLLPDDVILRRLRTIRHSSQHERNARRALSINAVATASGLSREYLHRLANGSERLGPRSRLLLSQVLTDL
jgi:AraC-like DNA-binding protein